MSSPPSYRRLFALPDFAATFVSWSVVVAAGTVQNLALATVVYARTGSTTLAALVMFGPSLAQVVGATTLLSLADSLPPRTVSVVATLIFAGASFLLAVPTLPTAATVGIVLGLGIINSLYAAVRWGLLSEIVATEQYVLGRSLMNMSTGVMQIVGYAFGAGLLTVLPGTDTIFLAGGLFIIAAIITQFCMQVRPARVQRKFSPRQTWRLNRALLTDPITRNTYLNAWLPNGIIVGLEALFVPYSGHSAGLLFMSGGIGMLVGDTVMGRFIPERWQRRAIRPLRLLLAVPYLAFAFAPSTAVSCVLVAVAALGFSASLVLQRRITESLPEQSHGHALGLYGAGVLTAQSLGALTAGALAPALQLRWTFAALAAVSLFVTALLTPGLRKWTPVPSEPDVVQN